MVHYSKLYKKKLSLAEITAQHKKNEILRVSFCRKISFVSGKRERDLKETRLCAKKYT